MFGPLPRIPLRSTKARIALLGAVLLGVAAVWAALTLRDLENQVEARFRGQLFAVPSRVYARPVALRTGLDIERTRLRERLARMGYVQAVGAEQLKPGEFAVRLDSLEIFRRPSRLPNRITPEQRIVLRLDGTRISAVRSADGELLPEAELEPEIIAQFHGEERADRHLVALADVPPILVDAIIATEDQAFYEHHGIQLWRIAGAFVANLRAGKVVQGGSTLTQQLVKNFYLTRERTLGRKLREVAMALLLERNHTKDEILEAYLNEVYMGQRGSIAIHGVGEAASHYFGKPPNELSLSEAALLAGLIKGPERVLAVPQSRRRAQAPRPRAEGAARPGQDRPRRVRERDGLGARRARRAGRREHRPVLRRGASRGPVGALRRRHPADRGHVDLLDPGRRAAARRRRRGDARARAPREELPQAAPQGRADPGGGGRARSEDGRDPRHGRRARLPAQPVQPRLAGAPSAGQRVQADRAAQCDRPARAGARVHARLQARGRAAPLRAAERRVGAGELRRRVPRRRDRPRGDRAVAERADRAAGARGGAREGGRRGAPARHREPALARAERRARRVRGHRARGCARVHRVRVGRAAPRAALLYPGGSGRRTRARSGACPRR